MPHPGLGHPQKVYGDKPSAAVLLDLIELGFAWLQLSEHHKAIECFTQALAIDQKLHGNVFPRVALHFNNLGLIWGNLGEYRKAIGYFTQALAIDQKVYGDKPHPDVATHLNNLGLAWLGLVRTSASTTGG